MTEKVWSVYELNVYIKERLESDTNLVHCYVSGEISNFKHHSSGHMYFTLKDERSRLRAVMFAGRNRTLAFIPEDGMRLIVRGSIGVFDRDGQYQLYVEDMQPDGVGALYVAFSQLKEKLEAEGLFAASRKRPLPKYPRHIGVVTSPTGAVIRDIASTLQRRYPLATVTLAPALVQGPGAAETIVDALNQLVAVKTSQGWTVDVVIIGRGGGSLEELWPFNEEKVARAVSACPVPVISAVGHETDFTICDFVADVRAATPTAAAELVAPHFIDIDAHLSRLHDTARQALRTQVRLQRERLTRTSQSTALTQPMQLVDRRRQYVDFLESQLTQLVARPLHRAQRQLSSTRERLLRNDLKQRLARTHARIDKLSHLAKAHASRRLQQKVTAFDRIVATTEALNPLTVLRRGYSVVYQSDGHTVISSTQQVRDGDRVVVHVADGRIEAQILGKGGVDEHVPVQSRFDI